ncbi:MAG: hypothetical protein MJ222_01290 [Bacilli bacterium]|nr:hypothetical protein [Bacilli bacterium]
MFDPFDSKPKSKKELEREYKEYIDDPLTFSIDEQLQVLGPRYEKI